MGWFDLGGLGNAISGLVRQAVAPIANEIHALSGGEPPAPPAPQLPKDTLQVGSGGRSRLLLDDDGGLISNNSGSLIANNSGNLISNNSGSLISNNSGSLISNNSASLIRWSEMNRE